MHYNPEYHSSVSEITNKKCGTEVRTEKNFQTPYQYTACYKNYLKLSG
jgi:hypothetical protein